jgi:hypothetical protein
MREPTPVDVVMRMSEGKHRDRPAHTNDPTVWDRLRAGGSDSFKFHCGIRPGSDLPLIR